MRHLTHWHTQPTVEIRAVWDYERITIRVFEATAAVYAVTALAFLGAAASGHLPRAVEESGIWTHIALGLIAAGLAGVAAAFYGLPRALGGRLWSVPLAGAHWLCLNLAVLLPAWRYDVSGTWTDEGWGRVLAAAVVLHAGSLAALVVNVLESVLHLGPGPREA